MRDAWIHILVLLLVLGNIQAQNYAISNSTVNDCYATFTDSNAGSSVVPSYYGHNEDLTFSICPNGADTIVLSFSSFCSELNLDVISFYDGPNLSSPQIGVSYSGIVSIPPIIATSGCLTVHFTSDASVACEGWEASWTSIISNPGNPNFLPISNPACNTNSLTLSLDQEVLCSSLNPSNLSIFGPSAQTITGITPLNCVNGSTDMLQVDFAPGLNANGAYSIQLSSDFADACDSLWQLTAFGSFTVSDCPIDLEIQSPDTQICTGTCTTLEAFASGGDSNYSYNWNNGLPSISGPHTVCPNTTTTYTCTVTDGSGAPTGFAQVTVDVIPPAVLPPNFTICQSDPNVDLDAVPNTGYWNGSCFGNDTLTGIFHPGWCGTGVKTIYYNNGGCIDSMEITINPMSLGATNQLVCPGSPAFNIWTNNPGGVFTGTGITDAALGTFDPVLAGPGVHNITYSNPPCSDRTKIITVGTATLQADDTICINSDRFTPSFSPQGGTWTGPGVTSWYWCRFDPAIAGPGTHELVYTYGNCSDTLKMTVIDIDAGNDLVVCPQQAPFDFIGSPGGGIWSGFGITNPVLGSFDPAANGGNNFTIFLTYSLNGCADSIEVFGRNTVIGISPIDSLCNYDQDLILNYNNTQRSPWGGTWSGQGVTNPGANGTFSPSVAGPGNHYLYYTNNTCIDSALITVFADPLLSDTSVCIEQSAFDLITGLPGGYWSGNGIVNPLSGTFLASLAGIGVHVISYETPDFCVYTMNLTVDSLPQIIITGLPDTWCFADTNFVLTVTPSGGIWGGVSIDSMVNPIDLGTGVHTVNYSIGQGECAVSQSKSIQVSDTLELIPAFIDTFVCPGEYVRLEVEGEGGDFLNYSYQWDNGLGGAPELVIEVTSSNVYSVSLNDGCSDEVDVSIQVNMNADFTLIFDSSELQCFGELGWLRVIPQPAGNYDFVWEGDSTLSADSIRGYAGSFYDIEVIDLNTGCSLSDSRRIPAYSPIVADFLVTPNERCVDLQNPEFYIIDQSIGGVNGTWSFGDGKNMSYEAYENFYHSYGDTGTYTIVLEIVNEGVCYDAQFLNVCVQPKTLILAPTAFSPNGDGINDEFFIRSIGANQHFLQIYNRWGELVFETSDIEVAWDGNFLGEKQAIGTYSWYLKYFSIEDTEETSSKGTVQLIR